ncbi:erythromycin esterase family protein [Thermomonospora cellulosilytica]|uniref:Erythromycin esterase-like protein n=1 Tax=Thermomonospora cellulosilytica TaxID=1411118 RepID=A0A7W3N3D3_9ACTN|nr:erythromycin esterase family protein [Thermomonospora cellulosilytica]MBA9006789.1 erythromycin esterase-like protein [Thermomonospora cellulosilytica]
MLDKTPDENDVLGAALPLEVDDDLGPLLDRIGGARIVLLGEASHGTHEFYAWRAALTRRLIREHGFSFVAVEGDWPDCWEVNRSVTGAPGAVPDPHDVLDDYRRWPTWMWANTETVRFCRRLRDHNLDLPPERRVGFYGLDLYSLWDSLRSVLDHVADHRPDYVEEALAAYRCFEPYGEDPQEYARHRALAPEGCADEIMALLTRLRRAAAPPQDGDPARELNAWQNAEVAAGAERYYRTMIGGGVESWNVRDVHMADTLDRLLGFHGPDSRAVVWAHNTHVGDARATPMADHGMVNLGQLVRERHGRDRVVVVGFAGGHGQVIAAPRWGAAMEAMPVPRPVPGSLEALLAGDAELDHALFVFSDGPDQDWLNVTRGHRAIGVVYDPDRDHRQFVPTRLAERYDALCWFSRMSALVPLHMEAARRGELETVPSGV